MSGHSIARGLWRKWGVAQDAGGRHLSETRRMVLVVFLSPRARSAWLASRTPLSRRALQAEVYEELERHRPTTQVMVCCTSAPAAKPPFGILKTSV